MPTSIIVEVVAGPDGELPAGLLRAVYGARESTDVTLVLRGTSPAAIEHIVNHPTSGAEPHAVHCCSPADGAEIAVAALTARFAICATDEFRAFMARSGVRCLEPDVAGADLRALTGPAVAVPAGLSTPFGAVVSRRQTAPA